MSSINSYDFATIEPVHSWVGGAPRPATSGRHIDIINPRHGEAMGQVGLSGAADVRAAVEAAQAAFPAWKATPIKERVQVFYRLKQLLEARFDELAWLVTHENGKVIGQARAGLAKAIECLEFGISLPNMVADGSLEVSRGVRCTTYHEPLGVCLGITPFNFPVMVPFWMLPQVLIAGNTFILKPSEKTPAAITRIAELFSEAGLPDGVLNVVHGDREAVDALLDEEAIKAIAFVGSTKVARDVYRRGTQTGRRVLALGGAKNHLIVVPDADLKMTAENVAASFTGCAGQRCMAAAVLVGVGRVDPIVEAIVDEARSMSLGEDVGPIIDRASVERITGYINEAEAKGARVLLDGRGATVAGAEGGFWIGPTVIDGVTPDMAAAREEIFGPVIAIVRRASVDDAIALENSSPYGNAASIYTTNGSTARYVTERVSAGMNGINIGVPVPREPFSFGGWNDSKFGHGDITGYDGFRFWTQPRKVTEKWAIHSDATWMS